MPLSTGTRLGPYEIVALLGAGGMGEVFRARDTKLDRDVALKILPATFRQEIADFRIQISDSDVRLRRRLDDPLVDAVQRGGRRGP